jgi:2,3-bisphosphoglycerate-dependent phosphoglycerate mutase
MTASKVLRVGGYSRELGPEDVIEALFTTISCRLESHGRGTRFPTVMNDLYSGYLNPGRAPEALRELQEIEVGLRKIPVGDVVWSLANFRRSDANEPVNRRAANAFDYFVDGHGLPLISLLADGLRESMNTTQVLRVSYPKEARDGLLGGLFFALPGVGWMVLGRAFFPNWCLRPISSHRGAVPIWTFGMDLVMLGAAIMIVGRFPAISDWFRRHQPALIAVVIILPIAWLVVCAGAGFLPD